MVARSAGALRHSHAVPSLEPRADTRAPPHQFHAYHAQRGAVLPPRGFRLSYDTDVPKQAGLSGSSAIVTAALSCLEAHFGAEFAIPLNTRPNLVLAAESALGITAGLQDRVVQSYEGVVYMDFEEAGMKARGYGEYTRLDPALLPRLWCAPHVSRTHAHVNLYLTCFNLVHLRLIWCDNPGDSGAVHSTVRRRWDSGDATTRELMTQVAALGPLGCAALEARDVAALAALMNKNFELRRQLFGDEALGAQNIRMVDVATRCGAAAKFTGSGGAVVALCPDGAVQEQALQDTCRAEGLRCELVRMHAPQ